MSEGNLDRSQKVDQLFKLISKVRDGIEQNGIIIDDASTRGRADVLNDIKSSALKSNLHLDAVRVKAEYELYLYTGMDYDSYADSRPGPHRECSFLPLYSKLYNSIKRSPLLRFFCYRARVVKRLKILSFDGEGKECALDQSVGVKYILISDRLKTQDNVRVVSRMRNGFFISVEELLRCVLCDIEANYRWGSSLGGDVVMKRDIPLDFDDVYCRLYGVGKGELKRLVCSVCNQTKGIKRFSPAHREDLVCKTCKSMRGESIRVRPGVGVISSVVDFGSLISNPLRRQLFLSSKAIWEVFLLDKNCYNVDNFKEATYCVLTYCQTSTAPMLMVSVGLKGGSPGERALSVLEELDSQWELRGDYVQSRGREESLFSTDKQVVLPDLLGQPAEAISVRYYLETDFLFTLKPGITRLVIKGKLLISYKEVKAQFNSAILTLSLEKEEELSLEPLELIEVTVYHFECVC